ncbi:hypothetical protein [Actinoplanes philippinensis]
MTDAADDPREDERADDYEYDEAHGGDDTGPGVPAALQDEAQRMKDLSPR